MKWLAPILCFTAEEAWLAFRPNAEASVHLTGFPAGLEVWRDEALAAKWRSIRRIRAVVTGALEIERAQKSDRLVARGRSAGVSSPIPPLRAALEGVDFADICITSAIEIVAGEPPEGAFALPETPGVGVVSRRAQGRKCARSWRISPLVGTDAEFPDVTPRDAQALRELRARGPLGVIAVRGATPSLGFVVAALALALDQASKILGHRPARWPGTSDRSR